MKHLGFKRYFTRPCEIYSHRSSLGKILKQLKGKEQFVILGNPKRISKYFHIQYFILNRSKTLKRCQNNTSMWQIVFTWKK